MLGVLELKGVLIVPNLKESSIPLSLAPSFQEIISANEVKLLCHQCRLHLTARKAKYEICTGAPASAFPVLQKGMSRIKVYRTYSEFS